MSTILLPARCDRAAAEALLPDFQAGLGSGALNIDASATQQIGQAMLQLLVSARRSCERTTIQPSPALMDVARLTGLEAVLFEKGEE